MPSADVAVEELCELYGCKSLIMFEATIRRWYTFGVTISRADQILKFVTVNLGTCLYLVSVKNYEDILSPSCISATV